MAQLRVFLSTSFSGMIDSVVDRLTRFRATEPERTLAARHWARPAPTGRWAARGAALAQRQLFPKWK
jgi:hypothetical protein